MHFVDKESIVECRSDFHQLLEEPNRRVNGLTTSTGTDLTLCDVMLTPGWYKFSSNGRPANMAYDCVLVRV